jgi:hypothetical protein
MDFSLYRRDEGGAREAKPGLYLGVSAAKRHEEPFLLPLSSLL